jgi:phosphopantetheinyl transferase
MINWMFSNGVSYTLQDCISDPVKYLNNTELFDYQKLSVPKRQMEWLASRLLVKQLVRESVENGRLLQYRSIEVRKETSGVPYVYLKGTGRIGWLSFSHSNSGVFAAFSTNNNTWFGVDIEYVEARSPLLFEDFFTKNEFDTVNALDGTEKDKLANLVWSAKESYLKATEKGLQMDTRRVEILQSTAPSMTPDWTPIEMLVNQKPETSWRVLYRFKANYVITMCISVTGDKTLARINLET